MISINSETNNISRSVNVVKSLSLPKCFVVETKTEHTMCTAPVTQVAHVATLFRRDGKVEKRGNRLPR